MKTSWPCRIVSYAPGGRSERKSTVRPPRCIRTHMFADHPKVHRKTVLTAGRQALQQLLTKCVPKREFSKAFTTLLNSHASHATGATKPRVLLMSGSLGEC